MGTLRLTAKLRQAVVALEDLQVQLVELQADRDALIKTVNEIGNAITTTRLDLHTARLTALRGRSTCLLDRFRVYGNSFVDQFYTEDCWNVDVDADRQVRIKIVTKCTLRGWGLVDAVYSKALAGTRGVELVVRSVDESSIQLKALKDASVTISVEETRMMDFERRLQEMGIEVASLRTAISQYDRRLQGIPKDSAQEDGDSSGKVTHTVRSP